MARKSRFLVRAAYGGTAVGAPSDFKLILGQTPGAVFIPVIGTKPDGSQQGFLGGSA